MLKQLHQDTELVPSETPGRVIYPSHHLLSVLKSSSSLSRLKERYFIECWNTLDRLSFPKDPAGLSHEINSEHGTSPSHRRPSHPNPHP
jgi:hypothetical protein